MLMLLLDVDWLTDEENRSMFHTEVAVMWSLSFNPNVITLLGYCENPRTIITKLYDTDLDKLIRNHENHLDYPARFHLMKGLAKALAATHELSIAHRDVKPKNVLIEIGTLLSFGKEEEKTQEPLFS